MPAAVLVRQSVVNSELPVARELSLNMQPMQSLGPPSFAFQPVRTAVLNALAEAGVPPAKLVAITAPTGYGKTVLLSMLCGHYARGGADCHWLALDDRDSSTERVLTQLELLLGAPGGELRPQQALHQGDEPVDERTDRLLEQLARMPRPLVIFIDNLNCCVDDSLAALIDALVFRTPPGVFLVLSSTAGLPFNRARAKLEGKLRQIGFTDLSLGEALCGRLSPEALGIIVTQTEGWPAAVRLMQIILAAADDPALALAGFSGADEDLAALLNRQVLQGLEGSARQFLLEVSLLRTFSAPLCRFALGNERAAEHIRHLLQLNLFMIPLDRNRSWYRLHALFREFLLDEVQHGIAPARRREILSRAAEWCEREGHWQDAMDYALTAGATGLVAAILERVAATFVRDRGDLRQFIEWVERLHGENSRGGWETDFWYVWALVFHRRYEHARQQLDHLVCRLRDDAGRTMTAAVATAYARRLEVIRLAIDIYTDRLADGERIAVQWLAEASGEDPFNVATVACAAAIQRAAAFDLVVARKLLRVAKSAIAQADSVYGLGWVAGVHVMILLHEGDFALAHEELTGALAHARAELGEHAGMVGTIALLAAKSAVETGRDEEAAPLLLAGLRKARSHGILDTAAFGLDAAVKLWGGRADDPISLARLRDVAATYPPRLSLMLSCFLVRRYLRLGRQEDALVEAGQIGLLSSVHGDMPRLAEDVEQTANLRELLAATLIELHIAGGRFRQAEALIAEEKRQARSQGRFGRQVELALDEAAIVLCSHNPAAATRHVSRAVGLAAKRRYLRPFRDRADMIAGLVNETRLKDWGFATEEERTFFAEICRGLPSANGVLLDQLADMDAGVALSETPTARELELLSLVELGLSNQQMADRLSVSLATVKWHLYNLYTKLGISSRAAALARARALGLLSR